MKYNVYVSVCGRVCVSVDAANEAAAKKQAAEDVGEMDFGVLENIDWDVTRVESGCSE